MEYGAGASATLWKQFGIKNLHFVEWDGDCVASWAAGRRASGKKNQKNAYQRSVQKKKDEADRVVSQRVFVRPGDEAAPVKIENMTIHVGDQSSANFLETLKFALGYQVSVIVDDGSHKIPNTPPLQLVSYSRKVPRNQRPVAWLSSQSTDRPAILAASIPGTSD